MNVDRDVEGKSRDALASTRSLCGGQSGNAATRRRARLRAYARSRPVVGALQLLVQLTCACNDLLEPSRVLGGKARTSSGQMRGAQLC